MAESDNYQIKLPKFEGPFDLLLFFIERDELNIHDIPIYTITSDFLAYIKGMKELNIELASEFILVAASLMRIKAKLLLPRKELNAEGLEIDPRQELVDKLLEYQRYKSVLEELTTLEATRELWIERGNTVFELNQLQDQFSTETELHGLNMYSLFNAFQRALEKTIPKQNVEHNILQYPFTIGTEKIYLTQLVENQEHVYFEDIFENTQNKMHCIYRFLALLECVQLEYLHLQIGEGFNNFIMLKGEKFEVLLSDDPTFDFN